MEKEAPEYFEEDLDKPFNDADPDNLEINPENAETEVQLKDCFSLEITETSFTLTAKVFKK